MPAADEAFGATFTGEATLTGDGRFEGATFAAGALALTGAALAAVLIGEGRFEETTFAEAALTGDGRFEGATFAAGALALTGAAFFAFATTLTGRFAEEAALAFETADAERFAGADLTLAATLTGRFAVEGLAFAATLTVRLAGVALRAGARLAKTAFRAAAMRFLAAPLIIIPPFDSWLVACDYISFKGYWNAWLALQKAFRVRLYETSASPTICTSRMNQHLERERVLVIRQLFFVAHGAVCKADHGCSDN